VALVAQDDIAAAVAMLREPTAHAGRTYDLTGHPARTLEQVLRARA
jgi:NAD(P)H dehydrogenase (quinone)